MRLNLSLYKRAILTDSRKFVLYGAWLAMGGWLFIQLNFYVASMSVLRGFGPNLNGLGFLWTLSIVNFFFVTLAGVMGFSSSITEEKEEDCLGLLIMTGISPLNLLASKTLARFTRGLFLLLSQMPFIILAVTLGGVSLQQVIAVYSVLISFMFVLCCLGTLVSLLFNTSGRAASITFLCLVSYLVFIFFLKEIDLIQWTDLEYFFPFIAMNKIFTTGYSEYIIPQQFFGCIILGILFFALSVFLFDKFALRKGAEKKKKTKVNIFRRGRPWHNALFWKEFNFNLSGRKGWIVQSIIYVALTGVIYYYMRPYSRDNFIVPFLAFSSLVFSTLILAVCASSMFSSEFKQGTHTSLFTLPEELSSIFLSKAFGAILYALPSIMLCLILFAVQFSEDFRGPDFEAVLAILSFIIAYIVLSGHLGLLMRLGSFIASAAILVLLWIALGNILFRSMGNNEEVLIIIVVNSMISVISFFMARNKLHSMIAR